MKEKREGERGGESVWGGWEGKLPFAFPSPPPQAAHPRKFSFSDYARGGKEGQT